MYADFEYYSTVYEGSAICEKDYPPISRQADGFLNRLTFGRLQQGHAITKSVKMAACAVADELFAQKKQSAALIQGVKSENTDGYSVTFEDSMQQQQALQRKLLEAADIYLPPYHSLRYAGIDRGQR